MKWHCVPMKLRSKTAKGKVAKEWIFRGQNNLTFADEGGNCIAKLCITQYYITQYYIPKMSDRFARIFAATSGLFMV